MRSKEDAGAPVEEGGEDRIGGLPDAVLLHILSFLPAEDAVQTCVLARRWRHLCLRIGCLDEDKTASVNDLRRFVDYLFLLRGVSPLKTCEFSFGDFHHGCDIVEGMNLWLRHAIACEVELLRLEIDASPWLVIEDLQAPYDPGASRCFLP